MIILGIDPGTAITGFGVLKKTQDNLSSLDYGTIQTPSGQKAEDRLLHIFQETEALIKKYNPDYIAVEKLYYFKNAKTVIPVSQARGVILLAISKHNIPLYEFTPLEVKTTTTGYGRSSKKQVQEMVKLLLCLEKIPKPDDAADGLAIAICCSYCI